MINIQSRGYTIKKKKKKKKKKKLYYDIRAISIYIFYFI